MKAAIFNGKNDVQLRHRPNPKIIDATDAIVMGCVCGSDLWFYRGDVDHTHVSTV